MSPTDLLEEPRKRPFAPIRLHISDGSTYDLRRPGQCLVSLESVVIGVAANPAALLFDRMVRVDNNHIVKLEPIRGTIADSPAG